MADRVLKTDFKRIGRSGPTVDGRVISPEMIDQMAASYDKNLFTALIFPEHQRYVNYGMVEELRATDNEEGGRDLWAVLSPNEFYTSSNHYGQKLFTSMEITVDFRKTGKAYLTGLGATDDPASAATSEIRLSKTAAQGGIILTKTVEAIEKTFEDTAKETLLDQIKALFKNQPPEENDMADKKALEELKTEIAAIKILFSKLEGGHADDKGGDKSADKTDPNTEAFNKLNQRLDALEAKFSGQTNEQKPTADDALKTLTEKLTALEIKLSNALQEQPGTDAGAHQGAGGDVQTDC